MIRKILFCLFIVSAVSFAACEKKIDAPDSLVNTSWRMHHQDAVEESTMTLYFFEESYRCELVSTDEDGTFNDSFSGKYYYTAPNVTIMDEGEALEGVVDGDYMVFVDVDEVLTFERL